MQTRAALYVDAGYENPGPLVFMLAELLFLTPSELDVVTQGYNPSALQMGAQDQEFHIPLSYIATFWPT